MTIAEIRKYESEDDMIPKSQEDQLEYLWTSSPLLA